VVEYVSGDGSEELDGTPEKGKFWVYEQVIQASYYAVHDPDRESLQVFELVAGRYRRMDATAEDRYAIVGMELELGLWRGVYQGYPAAWLRAWDANGKLLPTLEEIAEQERQHAEQERQHAEQERSRAEQERQRAEQERQRAEQERSRAEQAHRQMEQERNRAEEEKSRAEQERARAAKLAEKLRELGLDPDDV
jgi:flagellar biosynthesis GTPase FlhF